MDTSHYFPMCLSNGTDSMLVDWSGSMASGTRSLKELPLFWYKYDRRCARMDNLFPILRTGFCLYAGGDEVYKRGSVQEFDPEKAVLSTRMRCEGFDIRIKTFLTRGHALVEHYEILKTPKARCDVEFFIMTPDSMPLYHLPFPYLPGAYIDSRASSYNPKKDNHLHYTFKSSGMKRALECEYTIPVKNADGKPLPGTIIICCDHKNAVAEYDSQRRRADTMGSLGSSRLWVKNVKAGDSFARYTIVVDEKDSADHGKDARAMAGRPYETVRREHVAEWGSYARASHVGMGDDELERVYKTGLFHIRGNIAQPNGMLTLGSMPWLWGGWCSNPWDAWYCFNALVSSNRLAEARKSLEFFKLALPAMRDYARKAGCPDGAKFPWGAPSNELLQTYDADEIHHHGLIIDQIFTYYQTTKDIAFLKEFFPVLRGMATYMLKTFPVRGKGAYQLRPVIGVCEKASLVEKGWRNETWTMATTSHGLRQYLAACDILGEKEPDRRKYEAVTADFYAAMLSNYDEDGVLCHYPPSLGYAAHEPSLYPFLLFPELQARKTVKKYLGMDIVWSPARNPWAAAKTAQVLAMNKDPRAWGAFAHVVNGSNCFGGLVEHVQVDGAPHQEWYTTPHGAFLHAINLAFVHEYGKALRLLPAIPKGWKEFSCKNLRTRSGLLVSLDVADGKVRLLRIKNDTPEKCEMKIDANAHYFGKAVPGKIQLAGNQATAFKI